MTQSNQPQGSGTPATIVDQATQCPECGALLVVNLRGHRQFTCGREDIVVTACQIPVVAAILNPCLAVVIANRMMAGEQERLLKGIVQ